MLLTRQQTHKGYQKLLEEAERQDAIEDCMRRLMREDLFFLLVRGLGRIDADRDWLFDRCREVQNNPDGYLDLWAREAYKSTIITYALSIQDILNDAEVTIGIFSYNRPTAKAFLRWIKREFEGNYRLKRFFPEIFWENPQKEAPKWSEDDGIIVKRKSNPKESTVEAWGLVDSQPTGRHFKIMVYDDVVVKESVYTPDMIRKTTDAWELSLNLTVEDGGKIRYIGTRYHFNDTYKVIMDRKSAIPRIYPATKNGKVDGEPVLLTKERLAQKRRDMGPFTFGCQLLQNPRADQLQGFQEEWLQYWPAKIFNNLNLYFLIDPANEKRKENDYTSMWCVGLGADQNYYVVDMLRDRLNLTERTNKLFVWHQRYKPLQVGYEKYGMQADIEHIEFIQGQENYRFKITPLGGQIPQPDRIKKLIPVFEQKRLYLPEHCIYVTYEGVHEDLTQTFINEEYKPFPVGLHPDMLDSLARIKDPEFKLLMQFPHIAHAPKVLTQAEQDHLILTGQGLPGTQSVFSGDDDYE